MLGSTGRTRASLAAACRRLALPLAALAALAAAPARGEDEAFQVLREEQMVTAASKRPQPMSETPSIVTVITAEEIRTQGYRTLGEALQTVRGLYARYDRNYTYLGVRGVQRPGDYNNKVLLTLDGHTLNSPIYGDASFGRELGLDLERVERIEVIRGPGSALYGSNAVLAVVNVVTREPQASPAIETAASAGTFGERRGYLSLAGARQLNDRLKHIPTGAYGTRIGDPATLSRDGHDFVELSTRAQPRASIEWSGRAYWDGSRYSGDYAYGPDDARYINRDVGFSDLLGAESRFHWRPAEQHIATFGAEGRWTTRALQTNEDVDPYVRYTYSDLKSGAASVYAQDELHLGNGTRVTAGGRLDAESHRVAVISPRLDVHVGLGTEASWKVMAGSAYRAPVPYETHYTFPGQIPNPDLLPERVTTLETSLERRAGPARFGVSVYRS
jgi:outer membrane receptor for ferrienterochelin and colicin